MSFKEKIIEELLEKGKGDRKWYEIFDMFKVSNISNKKKSDKVRGIYNRYVKENKNTQSPTRQTRQTKKSLSEIFPEILGEFDSVIQDTIDKMDYEEKVEERDEINPNKGLILKSRKQTAKGLWVEEWERPKDAPIEDIDIQEIINSLEFDIPVLNTKKIEPIKEQMISISDVHLGMSSEGNLFKMDWCLEEFYKRLDKVIEEALPNHHITLCVLGDYTDGFEGKTARGGHTLPQNMNDKEMLKHGVEGLVYLLDGIAKKSNVTCYFLTNSNHPGITDFSISYAMENICELRYSNVKFNTCEDFITPVRIVETDYLLTHGYDSEYLGRGLPRFLSPKEIGKIRTMKEHHNLKYPTLLRGDKHEFTDVDYVHFRDIMCPAFSSPSGWISVNFFSKNNGGFLTATYSPKPSYCFNRF